MHTVQLMVILGYFLLIVSAGWFMKRYSRSSSEYLLAGQNMGLFMIVSYIVGEWLGGMSTVGTAEKAFLIGVFPIWYNFSTAIGKYLFGITVASVYRSHNVHTVGEMLETVYDKKTRVISSVSFVAAFVVMVYLQFQAIGSLASQMFGPVLRTVSNGIHTATGISGAMVEPFGLAVIIAGVLVIFYVAEGGIKSIAVTNFIHIALMYGTILMVFFMILSYFGGFNGLFTALHGRFVQEGMSPAAATATVSSFKDPFSAGFGTVTAWLLAGILTGFASQASLQPVFAAKDIPTAKKACTISAFFIAPLGIFVATIGMAVRTGAFGMPENPKETLPFLLMNESFLPPVLGGLAAAGILAAILSTVAPILFAISTIIVKDFYLLLFRKTADDTKIMRMAKIITIAVGVLSIPMAVIMRGSILDAAYVTYGIRGAGAVVVLAGIYIINKRSKRPLVTAFAARWAFIISTVGTLLFLLFKPFVVKMIGFDVDKVYIALLLTIIPLIAFSFKRNEIDITAVERK